MRNVYSCTTTPNIWPFCVKTKTFGLFFSKKSRILISWISFPHNTEFGIKFAKFIVEWRVEQFLLPHCCKILSLFQIVPYFWFGRRHNANPACPFLHLSVDTYLLSAIDWTNLLLQVTEDSLVCLFASENLGKTMFICEYLVIMLLSYMQVGTVLYGCTSNC